MSADGLQRARWIIAAIVALAVVLRLIYLADFRSSPLFDSPAGPDVNEYDAWAKDILTGMWIPDQVPTHGPLYAYLLAVLYAVTGRSFLPIRLFQLLMGVAAMAILSVAAAKRLGTRVGIATAAAWALYLPLFYYESELFSEGLALFLHSVVLALWLLPDRRLGRCALTGLLLGASAITHASSLLFGGMMVILYALEKPISGPRRVAVGRAAVVGAAMAIPVLPVALHNSRLAGEWMLTQGNQGMNLYIGNNPQADGTPNVRFGPDWDRVSALPQVEGGIYTVAGRRAFYYDKVLAFARERPGDWVRLLLRKLALSLNAQEITASAPIETVRPEIALLRPPLVEFGVLLALACVGMLPGRGFRLGGVTALVCAYVASQAVFVASGRYRVPMLPGMFVLTGIGISYLIHLFRHRSWARVGSAVASLALGLAIAFLPVVPAHNDDPAEAAMTRASAYRRKGDLPRAAEELRQAIAIRPDYAAAHVTSGQVMEGLGDFAAAERHYRTAVETVDDFAWGYVQLGTALARRRENAGALANYRRALEINPEFAEARYMLAQALRADGRTAEAIEQLQLLFSRSPDPMVSVALADALCVAGRYREALDVLTTAMERYPKDLRLAMRLAQFRAACPDEALRDPVAAVRLAENAAGQLASSDAAALDTLAVAYAAAGRFDRAVETAQQAIALAERTGRSSLAEAIRGRLNLYQKRQPYLEPATPGR